ncbi:hypothetical protein GNH96_10060 [Methylococcus geothermalis]|uniref:Polyketide cyclase/dehydrase n=2 Tax=Methylococcus geothermalis TaxID=2681310 RepID=A0A858Q8U7_9GAMM|nr:hypothetical protein GNH96_10060 [Methylococcus geothermalis]
MRDRSSPVVRAGRLRSRRGDRAVPGARRLLRKTAAGRLGPLIRISTGVAREIGAGSMEITGSSPPSRLVLKLDFIRPFEAQNVVEFTLEPQGETTQVTWAIHGPMPFLSKVMTVFFSMDKMIGKDFEAGLASLKAAAEN